MDQTTFWELIDKTRIAANNAPAKQSELLVTELTQLSPEDIMTFQTIHDNLLDDAFIADLWDAAYIIGCGCGDDGFRDFRDWLIGHGKQVFSNAINDAESLV